MTAFRKFGIIHFPTGPLGWVVTLVPALWLATVFAAIDRNSHSASDTLTAFFPYFGVTFLLWDWLARGLSAPARADG